METIKTIVRNIALITLLAGFLEMLLPNNSMRRFVQLVMGLFVLMAVLTPIANLLHKPLAFEIPAWSQADNTAQEQELAEVMQQGKQIRENGRLSAQQEYRKVIERQAKALALTVSGVRNVSIAASIKEDGQINKIEVKVGKQESTIKPVERVNGANGNSPRKTAPDPEQARIERELKTRIGAMLGTTEERVVVSF
ncbi:MAG TPA: stage III sporulation protein AF [Desulfobacteria bacterium]|nr:stage III sporulation protein AF [Desulfobacteria bacterium]